MPVCPAPRQGNSTLCLCQPCIITRSEALLICHAPGKIVICTCHVMASAGFTEHGCVQGLVPAQDIMRIVAPKQPVCRANSRIGQNSLLGRCHGGLEPLAMISARRNILDVL